MALAAYGGGSARSPSARRRIEAMYGPTCKLTLTDDRVELEGADLTGKLTRLALEVDWENRLAWASFQAAVDIDELGLTFPVETVKGYLGGEPGTGQVDLPREDIIAQIEAAIVRGQGFGRGENACGEEVFALFQGWGVFPGGRQAEPDEDQDDEEGLDLSQFGEEFGGGYAS